MAFSTDDFSKVWASTSPLTPYEFSDSNYKQGWNFVGSTPPARQMWDFLQKQNDEKTQWLYSNKLSLSGGTMSGTIVWSGDNVNVIRRDNGNDGLCIIGGDKDNFSGATLQLFGQTHSSYAGQFYLRASTKSGLNDTSHPSVNLIGSPDGRLVWDNKEIERVNSSGSNYIRYESGLQICWGETQDITASGNYTITYPVSFVSTSNIIVTIGRWWVASSTEDYYLHDSTATNIILTTIGVVGSGAHKYIYIAIGRWK